MTSDTAISVYIYEHDAPIHIYRSLRVPVKNVRGRPRLQSASTEYIQLPRLLTLTGQFLMQIRILWANSAFTPRETAYR